MRLSERLKALEEAARPEATGCLPLVVPQSATDAEMADLQRQGFEVFRDGEPGLVDAFV